MPKMTTQQHFSWNAAAFKQQYRQDIHHKLYTSSTANWHAFTVHRSPDLITYSVHLCPQLHLSCKFGEIPTIGL